MSYRTKCILLLIISSLPVNFSSAQESTPENQKLTPIQEVQSFTLSEGLTASVVTSEPDVSQPLSIEFDDRGRMWVLQYLQYPIPNGLKGS
ncbi:MAG: hypothetical protein R3C11_22120 [Planctomycetaceae bacterium]